ncbi:SDR family NAD(P)-dependent oxidoreductase, partial [Heyndrickxia sporothermodurans]|uniref:SDR family NAD(P)-dependent oxidoreductase n=1 Tax=Heyndrickxia sporothermodurans TaxID=46224 RepID=UPI001F47FED0
MKNVKQDTKFQNSYKDDDIAVIGIGFKIAGADNLEDYWRIFENNIDCIRDLPDFRKEDIKDFAELYSQLLDKSPEKITYNKAGYLDRIDEFDNEFFKISPIEAQVMDPVQRILLETVCNAFDDAGYTAEKLKGTKTGIYIGYTPGSMKDNYSTNIFYNNPELIKYSNVGNMPCIVPSRASYALNLHGPTMVIDSACSSSLVAIHDACVSIKNGTCSMAIAGGIRLHSFPIAFEEMNVGFETDDNKTRTFDNTASGAAIGEGSAVVLLKSLKEAEKDKDNIYAVIKGAAVNNDGTSASITAPNPAAQTQVILDAIKSAEITPDMIDYIETHGTATALGDPIEFRGLTTAFEKFTDKRQFCGLSSSKSNIGHLYEAAGVASFIKAIAALKNKKIPGSVHLNTPNLKIDFCDSPFYISNQTRDWEKDGLRVCGISAFGISGTNCHVILQEYSNQTIDLDFTGNNIIGISAKSYESLISLFKNYSDYLEKNTVDVHLFANNANLYRSHFNKRVGIVFSDKNDLVAKLNKLSTSEPIDWKNISGVYYMNSEKGSQEIDYSQIRTTLQRCNSNLTTILNGISNLKILDELDTDFHYLARMYSSGAKFDWGILYKDVEPRRISLPSYPFKRTRFWLPKKEQKRNLSLSKNKKDENEEAQEIVPTHQTDFYYQRAFVEAGTIERNTKLEKCLLIQKNNGQANEFHNMLKRKFFDVDCISIDINDAKRVGIEKYFSHLYREINFKEISHVVIDSLIDRKENWLVEDLMDAQKIQLMSVICLSREFLNYDNHIKVTPLMYSSFKITGEEAYLDPNGSPLFGMCKSLNRMSANISYCCIDIDNRTGWDKIIDEICSMTKKDIVAYRNDIRYFEELRDTEVKISNKQAVIKDSGVYLISGGLGGIGFETAMEMVNLKKNVSLVLIGRSKLPEEHEWENILRNSKDSDLAEKIFRLKLLKDKAKNVEYHALNIGDKESLQKVISNVNNKYGKINGVVHGAGVSGGITFDELNEEHLNKMMMPKVIGTYVLDYATRNQNLDFFLMFSSISTIFSSADLPGYVAGNMYLDSYSEYRNRECDGKSITVNWATWSETGMAKKDNFTIDTLFQTIKTKDAISALFNVLNSDSGSTVIARLNLKDKISMLLKTYPMILSPNIIAELEKDEKTNHIAKQKTDMENSAQYENIEEKLIEVCCKNLGYEEINIHHNFFELGANSILLSIIFKDLDEWFPGLLQVTDLFSYPSVSLLAEHISNQMTQSGTNEESFEHQISDVTDDQIKDIKNDININFEQDEDKNQKQSNVLTISDKDNKLFDDPKEDAVAIIGVGLDLPTSKNLENYWEMLINGINAVREIPTERAADITKHLLWKNYDKNKIRFRKSGYLDEINKFDHAFFGISPRDAALLDPVLRLFVECCSNAIDDSGYGANGVKGTNTGVFLGYTANLGNAYNKLLYEMDPKLFTAALPIGQVSMTASRAAYAFDLKGPSMVIDTACSSSLVALHMACEQIRFGKCEMALAGGASLMGIPLDDGSGIGFESPEEKTRAFSDNSSGAAIAEGVGVVLLKSLKNALRDGDSIYAVIKGSAINQDGSSFGIAAPNYLAQSEAIQMAWKDAGVTANDISYIEAHGTGTQLGDPIEVRGITNAFETMTNDKQICGLGSVKTNIGHANEAAGMCGLFKVILTLQNKVIPPTLNFQVPNNNIDFINSPLYIVDKPTPLKAKGEKAIIGISGFGMSGTNAHIILEEAPEPVIQQENKYKGPMIFTISGRTEQAVFQLVSRYQNFLNKNDDINLYDLASTINTGRRHYSRRIAFIYRNQKDLIDKLNEISNYTSLDMIQNDWCYSGHHAVVPEIKKEKYPHEITLKEQQKMSETAKDHCLGVYSQELSTLQEIMKLYVKGAEIEWKLLYNEPFIKLHLPTYPYERNSSWYKIPLKEELVSEKISSEASEKTIYDS